jgi:penicillin-binding protein 1A
LATAATYLFLQAHASEEEMLGLYASRVWVGGDAYGLQSASLKLFGKPLSQLSDIESATVAIWPRAPTSFSKNSGLLLSQRDNLMARARGGL